MSIAPQELQAEIKRILAAVADSVKGEASPSRDFSRAEAVVRRMKGMNELNSAAIGDFATCRKFEEVAAALGLLNNSAPAEMMMKVLEGPRADLVLIPCKAAKLEWAAVEAILSYRFKNRLDDGTLKLASRDYGKLSSDTAERTLRFWQLHNKIEK
jgi:hypothetical protein